MQFAYRFIDINAGQKILVRLRPPYAPDTFYDEEDVLHTMLHEVRIYMYRYCTGVLTSHSQLTHIDRSVAFQQVVPNLPNFDLLIG